MLSYQHAYHAGNIADVHKHSILVKLLHILADTRALALTYMETHAGRGKYQLDSVESLKTGEALHGVHKLLHAPFPLPWAHDYLEEVRRAGGAPHYPGSPLLARHVLRPQDTLELFELHPQEHMALKRLFETVPNVTVRQEDGLKGVKQALIDQRKIDRVILIDPSYEVKEEYNDVAAFVDYVHATFPEVLTIVWYPLLADCAAAGAHEALRERLLKQGAWYDELIFADKTTTRGMYGTGLAVLNPPKKWADKVSGLTEALHKFYKVR